MESDGNTQEVVVADRRVAVRDAGDPEGAALLYFHGTPGSRLDVAFGDEVARMAGVRVVSFDRPGHGGSQQAPFGLARIARDAEAIAGIALRHVRLVRWWPVRASHCGAREFLDIWP